LTAVGPGRTLAGAVQRLGWQGSAQGS